MPKAGKLFFCLVVHGNSSFCVWILFHEALSCFFVCQYIGNWPLFCVFRLFTYLKSFSYGFLRFSPFRIPSMKFFISCAMFTAAAICNFYFHVIRVLLCFSRIYSATDIPHISRPAEISFSPFFWFHLFVFFFPHHFSGITHFISSNVYAFSAAYNALWLSFAWYVCGHLSDVWSGFPYRFPAYVVSEVLSDRWSLTTWKAFLSKLKLRRLPSCIRPFAVNGLLRHCSSRCLPF